MGADLIAVALPCPPNPWKDMCLELAQSVWEAVELKRDSDDERFEQCALLGLARDTAGAGCWEADDDIWEDDAVVYLNLSVLRSEVLRIYSGQLRRNETWVGHDNVRLLVCGEMSWGETPEGVNTWEVLGYLLTGCTMPWEQQ